MKILAVDDNQDNLTLLDALLKEVFPDVEVLKAQGGKQGIVLAAEANPDVILLDIVMPDMDGYEVCRKLKGDTYLKSIPVVFLTVLQDAPEVRVRALEAGADGFLSKPIDIAELTTQVRVMAQVKAANDSQRKETDRLTVMVAQRTCDLQKMLADQILVQEDLQHQAVELRERNSELARFNRAAVDRELRMVELKQEVNDLCRRLNEPACYACPGTDSSEKDSDDALMQQRPS